MRVIFDNGSVADLENVDKIFIKIKNSKDEERIIQLTVCEDHITTEYVRSVEVSDGNDGSQESSNEPISGQSMVASESSEDAGQTGVGYL